MFIPVSAHSDNNLLYIYTYISTEEEGFWLPLLNVEGTVFITADDAIKVTTMEKYSETEEGIEFSAGYHKVKFSGRRKSYNGFFYYELQEIMDALSTRYEYISEDSVLFFVPCQSFYENLIHDCEAVFADQYQLSYLDNCWGYGVAAIYNIFSGMRIDAIWGRYHRELYETVLSEIMKTDNATSSLVELGSEGNSIMSNLSTVYEFNQTNIDDIREYCELFGMPYDEFIEAYDVLNNAIPYFDIEDFLGIAQKVYASKDAYELYVKAIKYGLVDNSSLKNETLKRAAHTIYSYYDSHSPRLTDVVKDAAKTVVGNVIADIGEKIFLKNLINIYIDTEKLLFDEFGGMGDKTKAVEQLKVCNEIQKAARERYRKSLGLNNYTVVGAQVAKELGVMDAKELRAIDVKYSTILYLRACQYAYSLYDFDDSLRWASEYWVKKTQTAIDMIAQYSDRDLSCVVKNEKLNLLKGGLDKENYLDVNSYIGLWGAEYIYNGIFGKELSINSVHGNEINYDIEYFRLYGYENQTAIINADGSATFCAYDEYSSISGTFEFDSDYLIMTIDQSSMEYMPVETVIFIRTDLAYSEPCITIEIDWDGISSTTGELLMLGFSLTGCMDSGESFCISDSPASPTQIEDKNGNIIAEVNQKIGENNGVIVFTIYCTKGTFNLNLSAYDSEMINLNEIKDSNAVVHVYYTGRNAGYNLYLDDYIDTKVCRFPTGVWCWDVFNIEHGILTVSESFLGTIVDYIGGDINTVVSDFGVGYIDDYIDGGHCYIYESIGTAFFFNEVENEKVYAITTWSDLEYGYGLTGKMTYQEIVMALSSQIQLGEPVGYYNMHDECYMYDLTFILDKNQIVYSWYQEPGCDSNIVHIYNYETQAYIQMD